MASRRLDDDYRRCISEALEALDVQNLVLSIHDPSYPSAPGENTGRGSPYTRGGRDFLRFARDLGFNGIQFGPQGQTTAGNRSPYDGTLFSKNILSIALFELANDPRWQGILPRRFAEAAVLHKPRTPSNAALYAHLHRTYDQALAAAYQAFVARRSSPAMRLLAGGLAAFRKRHQTWLEQDALYLVLSEKHHGQTWEAWLDGSDPHIDQRLYSPRPGEHKLAVDRVRDLCRDNAAAIDAYAFGQFVLDRHHTDLRRLARRLGLKLFGDMQIGISVQDRWSHRALFLTDYVMGAPPSRTNPAGQPWNYPVLDPLQYRTGSGAPGPVLALIQRRMDKLLSEFDGVRIDHPHGRVCPWVYHAQAADPIEAVQKGARLFESPDLPDHPALARLAIVAPDQLDRSAARHADNWVAWLSPEQVERYSIAFDCIVRAARKHHRITSNIICEVLSTQPLPLQQVLARYGLGRFRVTQKADLDRPDDVYRSENAAQEDWIMVGNHDTSPIWLLVDAWRSAGRIEPRAAYLAGRLILDPPERAPFAQKLATHPSALAQAMFADIFASRARNVMIFFSDLFGLRDVYNQPGVVDDENWSLRVPDDYESFYFAKVAKGEAVSFPLVLAMALRARGREVVTARRTLLDRLDGWARLLAGGAEL